jgi:phytanoyl-CoA hydroxylase
MQSVSDQAPSRVYEPYQVSVEEYIAFRAQGYLVVRNLISRDEVQELADHMDNLMEGREIIPGATQPAPNFTPSEKLDFWLRIHMLHRLLPIHERFILHPRTLDVLEALIGPDVLALQTMLFFKQPGQPGQGYHQDSFYIPTYPDSLCGAWLAIDRADEENGCLWMTVGSQHEPIYPDAGTRLKHYQKLKHIHPIMHDSITDENLNELTQVARKYPGQEVKVEAEPGDMVFFGGHVLHRSHSNRSDRSRRSFVGHYCNARSWVPWNHGQPWEGPSANYLHILARGATHLPYAQPKFGTPCAANQPQEVEAEESMSMMGDAGIMKLMPHGDEKDHEG